MSVDDALRPVDLVDDTPSTRPTLVEVLSTAMVATMLHFGQETGLLAALAEGAASGAELAERTGGDQRMAQEWAAGLCAAGLATSDGRRYRLDPETASAVAPPPGAPFDATPGIALFAALTASVPTAVAAYTDGGAAASDRYPAAVGTAMEQMSASWTRSLLPWGWIPEVPGLTDRLQQDGRVAEIGCGAGVALSAVVEAYPGVEGDGFELDPRLATDARRQVEEGGQADRVQILQADATTALRGPYDLVLALSVLHDVADLPGMLTAVSASLRPGGTLLVVESRSAGGPGAAMLLATSTLFCLPTTRYRGGQEQLGTLGLTEQRLADAAAACGLSTPTRLHSPVPMLAAYALSRV